MTDELMAEKYFKSVCDDSVIAWREIEIKGGK